MSNQLSANLSSPVKKGLQNIDKNSTNIENKDTDILHSMVAKLLWVTKGVSPNIDSSISFLCTRLTKSTKDYKAKLKRVLQYLKHQINCKGIMVEDSLS